MRRSSRLIQLGTRVRNEKKASLPAVSLQTNAKECERSPSVLVQRTLGDPVVPDLAKLCCHSAAKDGKV